MRWLALLAPALALFLSVAPAEAAHKRVIHTVRRGETLSSIAARYNTSVGSICRWNAIKRDAILSPGRKIGVPLPPGTSVETAAAAKDAPRVTSWRDLAKAPDKPGWVVLEGYAARWEGQLVGSDGNLVLEGRLGVSALLSNGGDQPIDPNLIALIAKVSDTFGGRKIRVVSGYRPGHRSRHATGQALDFYIDGVPNWAVRDYLLTLGKVGVGYYPNSYHVHLDVRETFTSWVDLSRPGQRARYVKPKRTAKRGKNSAKRARR
jgi:LysM repeat protein